MLYSKVWNAMGENNDSKGVVHIHRLVILVYVYLPSSVSSPLRDASRGSSSRYYN